MSPTFAPTFLLIVAGVSCALSSVVTVDTRRGWVGNSVGPGFTDNTFGGVQSAPNNYAAVTIDPTTGDVYTNAVWEESGKEMNRISADGVWRGRVEESHGWSRDWRIRCCRRRRLCVLRRRSRLYWSAYQPPQYPPTGVSWYGVFVVNKTSMLPVSWSDGVSFEKMLIVTSLTALATAAAVDHDAQLLYVLHASDGTMQSIRTDTMQRTAIVYGVANWSCVTIMSGSAQMWGVLASQVYQVDIKTGQPASAPLPGVDAAISVSASAARASTLVVADAGLHAQQVYIYDLSNENAPHLLDTIGERGGVWADGPAVRGMRSAHRFEWLTSAVQAANGVVMVICSSLTVWRGSEMMASVKAFERRSSNWTLTWELLGNNWVDSGSVDPRSNGTLLYMPNCVYRLEYPLTELQSSGRCISSTTDLIRYPQDPRLHQMNFSWQNARIIYLLGQKFLLLTGRFNTLYHPLCSLTHDMTDIGLTVCRNVRWRRGVLSLRQRRQFHCDTERGADDARTVY